MSLLNTEQSAAIADISSWLSRPYSEAEWAFVLSGPAGTGKTFCVKELLSRIKGRIVFTSPTNKAVKVLKAAFARSDDPAAPKPECRTIYSLLGLTMQANGEVKELAEPEDPVDLSEYTLLVVDESSMINSNVMAYLRKEVREHQLRVLFMGDKYQLPPVKEDISPVWNLPNVPRAELVKVMRHDNQILTLATAIREGLNTPLPRVPIMEYGDESQVLFCGPRFLQTLLSFAEEGAFLEAGGVKAIAWRNATVDRLNTIIRRATFPGVTDFWTKGDRVIFTEPATNLEGDKIASTDDEGVITALVEGWHDLYAEFGVYYVTILT